MLKPLQGYKTYLSAAAIILIALAGLAGASVEEMVAEADRLLTAVLGLLAILGRWDRERRGP